MKKTLLFAVVIIALFGYMAYQWMNSNGWSVFSKSDTYTATSTKVVKSTPSAKPILFVGDIMLGRYVETLSNRAGDDLYPFRNTEGFLKDHITIGNLEGPIPETHKPTPVNGFSFSFPSSTPRILKDAGVTAVTLANNHMFDQGRSGWQETKAALDAQGVFHFGGYSPAEDDYFETILGDTKVIVYGITMIATGWDEAQALAVTKKLHDEHPDAYLVAFLHWGDEYKTQTQYQRTFAHKLIDNGVGAVIGSHPHIVQGIETYQGKPIFYSLGNFVFDQYWRSDLEDGFAVELTKSKGGFVYTLIPVHSMQSVPSVATSTKRDSILSSINLQSDLTLKDAVLTGRLEIQE